MKVRTPLVRTQTLGVPRNYVRFFFDVCEMVSGNVTHANQIRTKGRNDSYRFDMIKIL